jgi:hypothetical protein
MDKSKRTQSAKSKPALDDVRGESSSRDLVTAGGKVIVRRDAETVVVSVPVRFYRRNGRQMILADSIESDSIEAAVPNNALLTALAKATVWQEELESGQYNTIEELADAKKVGRTYASRVMRLTSLCPQIVESILNGNESDGLSLRQLHKGVPDCWKEQMELIAS